MLEIGILLLAGAMLAIVAARALFLRPSPPRWTTWDIPGNLIVVAITGMAGVGLAATGMGIARIVDGTESPLHGGLALVILAVVVAAIVIRRRMSSHPVGPTKAA